MSDEPRLVLYHKQATSARLRFLRHAAGGICSPAGLPDGVAVETSGSTARSRTGSEPGAAGAVLHVHPGMLLRSAEQSLSMPRGSLEPDAGFSCRLVADGFRAEVLLGYFTTIDPPVTEAAAVGASFIELTEARTLPAAQLSLLRLIYEHLLG
jgi:hypothetical protein